MRYNGYDLGFKFTALCASRPLPTFRATTTTVDGMDGESLDGLTYGPRTFEITLIAKDRSKRALQDSARDIMKMLSVRDVKAFQFDDEYDEGGNRLTRYAVPSGDFDVEEYMRSARYRCKFLQPDPYLYGKSRSVVLSANQMKMVDIGGNASAYVKATASNIGTNYLLSYSAPERSGYIRYYGTFASGSKLNIDMRKQTAKPSGSVSSSNKGLGTGSRFSTVSGMTAFTASAKTEISWQERWL